MILQGYKKKKNHFLLVMRALRICCRSSFPVCMPCGGVNSNHRAGPYIPSTYWACNWKFVRWPPSCNSFSSYSPTSGIYKYDLFSELGGLFVCLFRLHIKVRAYSTCFSLSDLFHLASCLQGPSMGSQVARFHSFFNSWIIFHGAYRYHSIFIHSSLDGHLGCFHVLAIVNNRVKLIFENKLWNLSLSICGFCSLICNSVSQF